MANPATAKIYYETYCDTNGNKTLLPTGSIGDSDSVGWYLNVNHDTTLDGVAGNVSEKSLSVHISPVTASSSNSGGSSTASLHYTGTTFPYKTTMQDTASSWLIYNPDNSSATTNDFEVEFYNMSSTWTGHHNNATTTDSVAAPVTSKRILW